MQKRESLLPCNTIFVNVSHSKEYEKEIKYVNYLELEGEFRIRGVF